MEHILGVATSGRVLDTRGVVTRASAQTDSVLSSRSLFSLSKRTKVVKGSYNMHLIQITVEKL